MKKSEVLKLRLKQHPNSNFKMYQYYLCILKFDVEYKEKYNWYDIKCNFNNYNPLTWFYKLGIFIESVFKDCIKRYKNNICDITCKTYMVMVEDK